MTDRTLPPRSAYLHIPFCTVRCGYCDFNTYAGAERWMPAYVAALTQEIRTAAACWERPVLDTIFFGGGTPSLLPLDSVRRLVETLRSSFVIAQEAEVSLEANPCSITPAKLEGWLQAGVNRLSVGVQSLDRAALRFLDRRHDGPQALGALRAARSAGFANVSADLIYGIPGLGLDPWMRTLEGVLEARPDHVSAYELTVEAGTPLAARVASGACRMPDADAQLSQYWAAADHLERAGWEHYEISNWSRPGMACRHNLTYWRGEAYFGFGAGAHGMRVLPGGAIERTWNVRPIAAYITAIQERGEAVEGSERLDGRLRAAEAAMLGVRLLQGLPEHIDRSRFGTTLDGLAAAGLLESGPRPRLSRRGIELASEVGRAFLD